jgi:RNA polymerase-interacting CarD/CdnL/TRCF family regulator
MDYKRGDYVVHPNHGLGTVVNIEEMDFAGNKPSLFYRVDFRSTTVWIPVNTDRVGLRPLTNKRDLTDYQDLLKMPPAYLEDDFRKRQNELEARLEDGKFQGLCEVVRDLSARHQQRALNNFDSAMLKQSREALVQEWAASKGISPSEAAKEIDTLLAKAMQAVEVGVNS